MIDLFLDESILVHFTASCFHLDRNEPKINVFLLQHRLVVDAGHHSSTGREAELFAALFLIGQTPVC